MKHVNIDDGSPWTEPERSFRGGTEYPKRAGMFGRRQRVRPAARPRTYVGAAPVSRNNSRRHTRAEIDGARPGAQPWDLVAWLRAVVQSQNEADTSLVHGRHRVPRPPRQFHPRPKTIRARTETQIPAHDPLQRPTEGSQTAEEHRLQRALDMLPGVIAWLVIAFTVVASFLAPIVPVLMAIFIQIYWGTRALGILAFGLIGFRRIARDSHVDWFARYQREASWRSDVLAWDSIRHVVIIPNYKEPLGVLRCTLEALVEQNYLTKRIFVVLAMEEKEEGAEIKAHKLQSEFGDRLGGVYFTLHPNDIPGEMPGKSSNEAWAAKWTYEHLVQELGHDIESMTVTSCDADSRFHQSYFACLSYLYATNPNRHLRIWQAPLFFHNNAWDVPAFIRFVTLTIGINQLAQLASRGKHTFPISTYSASFKFLYGVGNWDTDVIPEDWHMYLKGYFARRGQVLVDPIFLPTTGDAPQGDNLVVTAVTRYQQALRHAWGITDFSYAVIESLRHREISFRSRFAKISTLLREHLLWSVSWFVLLLGFILPHLAEPAFFQTALGMLCSRFYNGVMIGASVISPLFPILDYLGGPPLPARTLWWKIPSAIIQWNLMPAVMLFLVAIPSLHAQTRLMVGRNLIYRVTQKIATTSTG